MPEAATVPLLSQLALGAGGQIASGLLSVGGQFLQNYFNNKAIDKQNAANKELAKYSYDQQKQMIEAQNRYNSPAAQMQRYIDAGLNPNLIYGNISSGNQSQVASYNAPAIQSRRYDFSNLQSIVDTLYSARMRRIALDSALTDVANKQEDNESKILDNALKRYLYFGETEADNRFLTGESPYMRKYNAEVSGIEELVDLRRGQQILNSLSAAQQNYIINNILPYQAKSGQLNSSLLEKQLKLYNWKFGTDMTAKGLGSLLMLFKLIL